MNIYINGRFLTQDMTGINRFSYQICKSLRLKKIDFSILVPKQKIKDVYDTSLFDIKHIGWGKSHFWEQISMPLYLLFRKKQYILMCFSGLGPILVKNKITTIHDISYAIDKTWFNKLYIYYYTIFTPLCIKTSLCIFTVSESSKSDIIKYYKTDANKIKIIYNAVDLSFFTNSIPSIKPHDRYLLAVSSIDPRKNFKRLIDAFNLIEDKTIKLYIIGGQNNVFKNEKYSSNKQIYFLGRVKDSELIQYYRNAVALIYPSLYEGFGLPTIEAMSLGCPVLTSNIPSLKEVCSDAAIYFNPYDIFDIKNKINALVNSTPTINLMKEKGLKNVLRFNWDKSADKIISYLLENSYMD